MTRLNKVISAVVALSFLVNTVMSDYVFALSPTIVSSDPKSHVRTDMWSLAHKRNLQEKGEADLGSTALPFSRQESSIKPVNAYYNSIPTTWSTTPVQNSNNTLVEMLLNSLSANSAAEVPVFRMDRFKEYSEEGFIVYEVMEKGGKRQVVLNREFIAAWNYLNINDVGFKYDGPAGKMECGSLKLFVFNILLSRLRWSCYTDVKKLDAKARASEIENVICIYGNSAMRDEALRFAITLAERDGSNLTMPPIEQPLTNGKAALTTLVTQDKTPVMDKGLEIAVTGQRHKKWYAPFILFLRSAYVVIVLSLPLFLPACGKESPVLPVPPPPVIEPVQQSDWSVQQSGDEYRIFFGNTTDPKLFKNKFKYSLKDLVYFFVEKSRVAADPDFADGDCGAVDR